MKWKQLRRSKNVEDRRGGPSPKGMAVGGGIGTLVLAAIVYFMGGDVSQLLSSTALGGNAQTQSTGAQVDTNDEGSEFVRAILGSTEDVWTQLFASDGKRYAAPKLVLFRDAVRSACGSQSSAEGPFYCPADDTAYLDLTFFDELATRFGAPGDFAQAYVIAHEIGHHIQNLLGTSNQVHAQKARVSETEGNVLSVRLELQADCYAGIWAHHAQNAFDVLEEGDLEEALRAANQIGDDRLQMKSRGHVSPDSFTHGTAEQRARWFLRGFRSGSPSAADTFSVQESQL